MPLAGAPTSVALLRYSMRYRRSNRQVLFLAACKFAASHRISLFFSVAALMAVKVLALFAASPGGALSRSGVAGSRSVGGLIAQQRALGSFRRSIVNSDFHHMPDHAAPDLAPAQLSRDAN